MYKCEGCGNFTTTLFQWRYRILSFLLLGYILVKEVKLCWKVPTKNGSVHMSLGKQPSLYKGELAINNFVSVFMFVEVFNALCLFLHWTENSANAKIGFKLIINIIKKKKTFCYKNILFNLFNFAKKINLNIYANGT